MRRLAFLVLIILIITLIAGLCQTAVDPDDFRGEWYSVEDQSVYLFQDGLIHCTKYAVTSMASNSISGAYTYCSDSVFLFAKGVPGLETEKEIYLLQKEDSSFLCEHKDGTGKIYFIRSSK